jgi:RimJ/RimL family protein N-acetyltransferase
MCKFLTLKSFSSLRYLPDIKRCFSLYYKYFQDDFSPFLSENITSFLVEKSPTFWIITDRENSFMGFVYLDNFIGSRECLYSAELTTCFDRKAWGSFTRYSAKFFLKYCFDKFGFSKIKAQIYPQNFRVKTLLKACGFIYESTLKSETLRGGKPQDIEVYSLYRNYYYKTR